MAFVVFAYFQNGGKPVKTKQKVAYLGKYCFDLDYVYIKLYVFWGAETKCKVTGEVRGHAHLVEVKVNVILAK